MNLLPRLLFSITVLLLASSIQAEQATAKTMPTAMPTEPQSLTWGYLGLKVDTVPESVKAHFPDAIATMQGLMVTQLLEDSPAADDGIKLYDVLVTYDDQPIKKAQQFIETIKKDVPGRLVKIKLLRQGEILVLPITIGGQQQTAIAPIAPAPRTSIPAAPQIRLPTTNTSPMPYYQPYPSKGYPPYGYPVAPRPMAQVPPRGYYPPRPPIQQPIASPVQNVQQYNIVGQPAFPMRKKVKKEKKAWGDKRNIWPDTYTDFTGDLWDSMMNAPFDVGRMPGGWRAPSLSTPDPVTVGDAVTNQLPPMVEEMGNMTNFAN